MVRGDSLWMRELGEVGAVEDWGEKNKKSYQNQEVRGEEK